MKKSIVAMVVVSALFMSGCAVGPEVHKAQAQDAGALKAYHKAEKQAIKAEKANKVAGGAFVATTAAKVLADQELKKAKAALDETLNK